MLIFILVNVTALYIPVFVRTESKLTYTHIDALFDGQKFPLVYNPTYYDGSENTIVT